MAGIKKCYKDRQWIQHGRNSNDFSGRQFRQKKVKKRWEIHNILIFSTYLYYMNLLRLVFSVIVILPQNIINWMIIIITICYFPPSFSEWMKPLMCKYNKTTVLYALLPQSYLNLTEILETWMRIYIKTQTGKVSREENVFPLFVFLFTFYYSSRDSQNLTINKDHNVVGLLLQLFYRSATGYDDKTVKHKQFLLEIFWGNLLRSKWWWLKAKKVWTFFPVRAAREMVTSLSIFIPF